MAVSLAMMFTPVFGSYSYMTKAYGEDTPSVQNGQNDQVNEENQPGNGETPSADQGKTDGTGAEQPEGQAADGANEPENAPADESLLQNAPDMHAMGDTDENGDAKADSTPVNVSLNQFVTSAKINATKDADGKYVIRAGTKYSIDVAFKETMSRQFPNGPNDTMTYTLPEGLSAANGDEGTFSVRVNDGGTYYTVKNNTYEVREEAQGDERVNYIVVKFNTDDENFDRMAAAANVTFTIDFEGEFDGNTTKILFEDDVEVDLEIDRSSSLKVKKTQTPDFDNGKINYKVTIDSVGNNTDVVVKDLLKVVDKDGHDIVPDSGPAYTPDVVTTSFFDDNFIFTSNLRSTEDLMGLPITMSSMGNDVRIEIPEILDGETITIDYYALVRPDKIPSHYQGLVYTSNGVSVDSEESDEDKTETKKQIIDYTPGITKDVDVKTPQTENQPGVLTWKVTVDKKAASTPIEILDKIGNSSQKYLTYIGDGIHIDRYDADGNKDEDYSRTVAWEDLSRGTNSDGKYVSWSYNLSDESSDPYKYVITYDTEVDTKGEHVDITVSNDVSIVGGKKTTGKRIIGPPDGYMDIKKRVLDVDLDNKTITWGIDIKVPKSGVAGAYVRDKYPRTGSIFEPVESITVEPEDTLYDRIENSDSTQLNFYYMDGTTKVYGLAPSAEERTVKVTITTPIDERWLNNSSITAHSNTVDLKGKKSSTDSIVVEKPGIMKNAKEEPVGYRMVDGVELPVYRYELILSHVTKDAFFDDNNNPKSLTIEDTFDKNKLVPYTPSSSDSWYKSNDAWYVFGGGTSSQTKIGSTPFYDPSDSASTGMTPTATGMKMAINDASVPHDLADVNSPKHYYPRYKLVYYLTVKDKDAYDAIMDGAISAEDGKYKINNKAKWEDKEDGTKIDYEYPGLTKEILTPDSELKVVDNKVVAKFRIVANPSAKTLNKGKPITLTDTADNLIIDTGSITINGKKLSEYPEDSIIKATPNGHSMVYTIPDSTKIVIEYSAEVEYKTIGTEGQTIKVDFNNVVDMLGYDSNVKKTASRQNRGAGAASVPQINLKKFEAGDISKTLEGAEFALLDGDGNPVKDKNGDPVTFTSGNDGIITVRGDMEKLGWVLEENKTYYLKETKAPDNHILITKDFEFQISEDGTSDVDNHIYSSGYTVDYPNYPKTSIDVEKVWSDGNNLHDADEITVKLQQKIGSEGEWSDTIRMFSEDNVWSDINSVTATLNKDNEWKHTFSELPTVVPTKEDFSGADTKAEYRILETEINGKESEPVLNDAKYKETTYDSETEGNTTKIKVTNVYVPDTEITFEAEKMFEGGVIDQDGMFKFTAFEVTGNKQLNLVSTGATTQTGSSTSKVVFTPVKYTLDDLKKADGTFARSKTFTYIIREAKSPNAAKKGLDSSTNIQYDTADRTVTVTLSLDGSKLKAEVNYGSKGKLVFTNTQTPPPSGSTGDSGIDFRCVLLMILSLLAALLLLRRRKEQEGRYE